MGFKLLLFKGKLFKSSKSKNSNIISLTYREISEDLISNSVYNNLEQNKQQIIKPKSNLPEQSLDNTPHQEIPNNTNEDKEIDTKSHQTKAHVIKLKPRLKLPAQHIFKADQKQTNYDKNETPSKSSADLEEVSQSKQTNEEDNETESENFRKSTLIFMTENHDHEEHVESDNADRESVTETRKSSTTSVGSLPNNIKSKAESKGYSSQAALLFFEDEYEPQPLPRKRNIKLQDDTSLSGCSEDC